MATNIQTTQLDFDAIKTSLKTHFAAQPEFADYNFEGAGLSNILDVLAYNTHYNGLLANFALNESFLNTAQLRSSIVSHAQTLGAAVVGVEDGELRFRAVALGPFQGTSAVDGVRDLTEGLSRIVSEASSARLTICSGPFCMVLDRSNDFRQDFAVPI